MTGVANWLEQLRSPACYPEPAATVTVVQTHISVVCLAGDRAYKLKKRLRLPFLDFSTLARRRHYCCEEVRLNRRLCPDVYLGVVPLRRTPAGLRFGPGDGEIVEHAVLMRRLPAERMLDRLIREHAVQPAEIAALACQLAAFHATADRGPQVLAAGDPARLAGFARANFDELDAVPQHGLPPELLGALRQRCERDFARLLPVLQARAAAGRVVDGHGDLHARNVCMTTPPVIYDCIEFEPAFRCGDVATEVAFLAMDLRHRGARALARTFVAAYAACAGDPELPGLLPALVAYRAMIRAKVAAIAAAEPQLPAADRRGARGSAAAHVELAAAATLETDRPLWLLLCGPPASGKSTVAQTLVAIGGWPVVVTDRVRKGLAGLLPTEQAGAEHYTAAFSDRTYAAVLAEATAATADGEPVVVLDGNFPSAARRARAAAAATAAGARLHVLHVAVPEEVARQRITRRAAESDSVSDAGPAEFAKLWSAFAPPTAAEALPFATLDGARRSDDVVAAALAHLVAVSDRR